MLCGDVERTGAPRQDVPDGLAENAPRNDRVRFPLAKRKCAHEPAQIGPALHLRAGGLDIGCAHVREEVALGGQSQEPDRETLPPELWKEDRPLSLGAPGLQMSAHEEKPVVGERAAQAWHRFPYGWTSSRTGPIANSPAVSSSRTNRSPRRHCSRNSCRGTDWISWRGGVECVRLY